MSVYDHVISPASEGLFQRSIIISAGQIIPPTLKDEEHKVVQMADELGKVIYRLCTIALTLEHVNYKQ